MSGRLATWPNQWSLLCTSCAVILFSCRGIDPTLLIGPVEGLLSRYTLFIEVIFASAVSGDGVYIHQLTY